MGMVAQAFLSVYGNGYATVSYSLCDLQSYELCNCVLRFMGMVAQAFLSVHGNGYTTVSYSLCNCVLRLMEMVSKQFFPFMETVLQVVRAKISGYIKS